VARLDTIPGIGTRVAEIIVAEVGRDMSRFPSAAHLASWAGLCPGHKETASKRSSGRTRPGSPALRRALVEAARATARTRTCLAAQFHRLAARRGSKRAAVAVARSMLVIAYQILRDGGVYQDLGQMYFDERDRTRLTQRLLERLRNLGLVVEVQPIAAREVLFQSTAPWPAGATRNEIEGPVVEHQPAIACAVRCLTLFDQLELCSICSARLLA
jgi:hypothetical protein